MPPAVKFQKEDIVEAALNIVRKKGIDAVTAREVARELRVSVGPIFTWFQTMEQLRTEVHKQAEICYRKYIERGLAGPIPFLGLGQEFVRFAREEPELYKLLFLRKSDNSTGGAMESMRVCQELARESVMRVYNMEASQADCYFRDLWLVAFSFATLVVTNDAPFSEEEMSRIMSEISLSVCKAYKEVPGLIEGNYDRDAVFRSLVTE